MTAETAPLSYEALVSQLMHTCRAWQAARSIDEHDVGILMALVHLCEFAPEYYRHADFPCLNYEIQVAAKAFLAKDFHECERHLTEANTWKATIEQEVAEERAKRHKTPVR